MMKGCNAMCNCFSLFGAAPRAAVGAEGTDVAGGSARIRNEMSPTGPWVDVHAHPGRCFLRGTSEEDAIRAVLGPDDTERAVEDLRVGHVALSSFSTVADLRVLSVDENGIKASREFEPEEAWLDHERQLAALLDLAAQGNVRLIRTPGDLTDGSAGDAPGMLVTCEGGDFLEGRLSRVEEVWDRGVRSITLVHYRVNELGDIQTESPRHDGLTDFGLEVVREMNRLGMIIDLAHATWAVTRDVLDRSSHPVMISHSHLARDEDSHPRLISKEHALAVARAGGIIGAWPAGVELQSFDDYLEEILRMIELLGVEHVSIGTDMDANYQPVLTSHREMPSLAAGLHERGLSESEMNLVMGGNFLRLFEAVANG
jgi:membrane dipeptidase